MSTPAQKAAVVLAFVAAVLSLSAAAVRYWRAGEIEAMLLFGGLLMLSLGISGYFRLGQRS